MGVQLQHWVEQLSGLAVPMPGGLVLMAVALAVAVSSTVRRAPSRGLAPDLALGNARWAIAGGLLGARLAHWLERESASGLGGLLSVWDGGLSLYGGLLGVMLAMAVAPGRPRRSWAIFWDTAAAPAALALCIGRLGCLMNGDDFGAPSAAPWAIRFLEGTPAYASHLARGLIEPGAATSLPVHPTQLYEMAFALGLWLFLRRRPPATPGREALLALAAYASFRFFLEWAREPTAATLVMGLTTGQLGSLFFLGVSAATAAVLAGRASAPSTPRPT